MEKTKKYYTEDLIEEAKEELRDRLKEEEIEIKLGNETQDILSEIADNNIPIYTYDLLQYASNNFDLIEPNELYSDNPSVISIIQANIYELLTEALYEHTTKQDKE